MGTGGIQEIERYIFKVESMYALTSLQAKNQKKKKRKRKAPKSE